MQQPHFDVTDAPQDLSAFYPAGQYLAQLATIADGSAGVLYGTATTPPADDADFFVCNSVSPLFIFHSGTGTPTWCKTSAPGLTLTLAVAQLGN